MLCLLRFPPPTEVASLDLTSFRSLSKDLSPASNHVGIEVRCGSLVGLSGRTHLLCSLFLPVVQASADF